MQLSFDTHGVQEGYSFGMLVGIAACDFCHILRAKMHLYRIQNHSNYVWRAQIGDCGLLGTHRQRPNMKLWGRGDAYGGV